MKRIPVIFLAIAFLMSTLSVTTFAQDVTEPQDQLKRIEIEMHYFGALDIRVQQKDIEDRDSYSAVTWIAGGKADQNRFAFDVYEGDYFTPVVLEIKWSVERKMWRLTLTPELLSKFKERGNFKDGVLSLGCDDRLLGEIIKE